MSTRIYYGVYVLSGTCIQPIPITARLDLTEADSLKIDRILCVHKHADRRLTFF